MFQCNFLSDFDTVKTENLLFHIKTLHYTKHILLNHYYYEQSKLREDDDPEEDPDQYVRLVLLAANISFVSNSLILQFSFLQLFPLLALWRVASLSSSSYLKAMFFFTSSTNFNPNFSCISRMAVLNLSWIPYLSFTLNCTSAGEPRTPIWFLSVLCWSPLSLL